MSYNLIFKITKDLITINEDNKAVDKKSLNNTSIIDTKLLKFSPEYIKSNIELVASFLKVTIIKNNITRCIINTTDYIDTLIELINRWDGINELIIKQDITIDYKSFMKLLDNNTLLSFECYSMPEYLLDRLDLNKAMTIKTRKKEKHISKFMNENLLNSYSDIYYKKHILIYHDINDEELNEFQNFMCINNNLKTIKLVHFTNENLTLILDELKNNSYKNVTIIIDEKNNDLDIIYKSIPYIKKSYKKFLLDNNINFKIDYSFDYKKKNFAKEFNLKLLSAIILFIVLIILAIFGVDYYKEYRDQTIVEDQMIEINKIVDEYTSSIPDVKDEVEVIDPNPNNQQTTTTPITYTPGTYYTNYSRVFEELDKINTDTVGWIKINNTRMDYPVVQSTNNDYYLNRDFKKNRNSMGWIFMDYNNNPTDLDKNTIIYGHNIRGGIMFGGIGNMFNKTYLSKPANNIIIFNSRKANMKWKIFSMYKIEPTTDYIRNSFYSNEEYKEFIQMIKGRSQFEFDVNVTENDKILTLSTCFNNKERMVVHAVLIEVNGNEAVPTTQVEDITESPTITTFTTP